VVLNEGAVYGEGAPGEILTADTLRDVFGVDGRVLAGPDGVEMVIVPVARLI
jgi:ABC-type cobalamin/Fe3+-siderophores transport system ATPase subunit